MRQTIVNISIFDDAECFHYLSGPKVFSLLVGHEILSRGRLNSNYSLHSSKI